MLHATPAEIERREDAIVLGLLAQAYPALFAVDEVVREVGDQLAALDALSRLECVGLVHRMDVRVADPRGGPCA